MEETLKRRLLGISKSSLQEVAIVRKVSARFTEHLINKSIFSPGAFLLSLTTTF